MLRTVVDWNPCHCCHGPTFLFPVKETTRLRDAGGRYKTDYVMQGMLFPPVTGQKL